MPNLLTNYGASPELLCTEIASPPEIDIVYLAFQVSSFAGNTTNDSTLRLYVTSIGTETMQIGVHYSLLNWSELDMTYTNKVNYSNGPTDVAYVSHESVWYEWNVTQILNLAFANNASNVTLVLASEQVSSSTDAICVFASKETARGQQYVPQPIVNWSPVSEFQNLLLIPSMVAVTLIVVMVHRRKQPASLRRQRGLRPS